MNITIEIDRHARPGETFVVRDDARRVLGRAATLTAAHAIERAALKGPARRPTPTTTKAAAPARRPTATTTKRPERRQETTMPPTPTRKAGPSPAMLAYARTLLDAEQRMIGRELTASEVDVVVDVAIARFHGLPDPKLIPSRSAGIDRAMGLEKKPAIGRDANGAVYFGAMTHEEARAHAKAQRAEGDDFPAPFNTDRKKKRDDDARAAAASSVTCPKCGHEFDPNNTDDDAAAKARASAGVTRHPDGTVSFSAVSRR